MKPAISLKGKISGEGLTLGLLVTDHTWPGLVERCHRASLDYLIIDMEHGYHSREEVALACQIGRLMDFPVLIRPISSDPDMVRRALDLGPCGLMVPAIEGLDQLDEIQTAIFMPPRGKRRPGGLGVFWVDKYDIETWKSDFEDHVIILPQIETQEGLDHVDQIANHEIVTAMAIGPYDLSVSLGYSENPQHPTFREAIQRIRHAGVAAGKNTWIMGNGKTLIDEGFTFLCVGEPSYMLETDFRKKVEESNQHFDQQKNNN